MSKIDLTFDCEEVYIVGKGSSFKDKVTVKVENADQADFDNENIAKCIRLATLIEAHGIQEVLDYIHENHMEELDGFIQSNYGDE